ncbi:DUF1015 domain-containing protein [Streptomyces microflavus]|uniref:DUF1015 domain-containing protein n=1 Tax=Streptomyces TaxID=1883 RepID=UPI0005162435|nr:MULTISPECIES: DUF1015 domain-containing protein [Streptomyces]MDX2981865.1 DUF1015 domain-containing protein [Streptomyces sp. NRRL_B-2249]GGX97155.1 hypothetical protein GCM10010298_73210 [Streptomyces microflavus]
MPTPEPPDSPALRLHPFRAVRYDPLRVGDISGMVCPPYDDIGPDRVRTLRSRPHHITRLLHAENARGTAAHLDRWLRRGVLVRDPRPTLYVYQQHTGQEVLQRGVIGALDLPRDGESTVIPHEGVQPHVVTARAALMKGLRAQPEPLLLTYNSATRSAAGVIDSLTQLPPVATVRIGGVTHMLWACTSPEDQALIAADLAPHQALIADGHHRYAACIQLRDQHGPGPNPWQSCLALLVDASTYPLRVAAIHRVIPGLGADKAAAAAADVARVRPLPAGARLPGPGELVLTGAGRAWAVTDPDPQALNEALTGKPQQWCDVPAAVTDHLFLAQAWSVQNLPGAVRHVHDAGEATAAVSRPGSGTTLLLPAMTERAVRELAGAGVLLPRKSTSFGPKPAVGLVLRVLDSS